MDLYRDRRPSPALDGDDNRPLERNALRDANARVRAATPLYQQGTVNTKIRTTAVQRFRARERGQQDFATVGEYLNFLTGTDDGSQ